ncbi:6-bladed beta-propeller [Odoribacter laneus]|uniref:6-bladed beta-propeller n=1 Tax=Odoribacter laneus TaxID=626933 RepID=UPI0039936EE7
MKYKFYIGLLFLYVFILSCTSGKDCITKFISVDIQNIKEEVELPISELTDSLEIIQLDSILKGFIGMRIITDHYIGIMLYDPSNFLLFNRQGKFITSIGGEGYGPGEYQALYHAQLDEKVQRVYLAPYTAKQILTYNLKGRFLPKECIKLSYLSPKNYFYVDHHKKRVTVINLPFSKEEPIAWVQDFKGNIYQKIAAKHLALRPDYSNEISTFRNTEAIDFSISAFFQKQQDTLYYYDSKNNKIIPKLTLNAPRQPGKIIYSYLELPLDYFIILSTIQMGNNPYTDISNTSFVQVNKKTQQSQYVKIVNDYLGGIDFVPSTLFNSFRNGYFAYPQDAMTLREQLTEALENPDLLPEVRTRISNLLRQLKEKDGDVMMIGKLKTE